MAAIHDFAILKLLGRRSMPTAMRFDGEVLTCKNAFTKAKQIDGVKSLTSPRTPLVPNATSKLSVRLLTLNIFDSSSAFS
jgi:hypothetical protein